MPYKCDECDFASVYKDKYNTHVKIHLRAKGMTEEEANTTLYYYCDKCGKQFTNQYRDDGDAKRIEDRKYYLSQTCLFLVSNFGVSEAPKF